MGTKLGFVTQMNEEGPWNYGWSLRPNRMKLVWEHQQLRGLPVAALQGMRNAGMRVCLRPHFGDGAGQVALFLRDIDAGVRLALETAIEAQSRFKFATIQIGNEFGIEGDLPAHSEFVCKLAPLLRLENITAELGDFPVGNPASSSNAPPYEEHEVEWLEDLQGRWWPFYPALRAIMEYGHNLGLNQYAPTANLGDPLVPFTLYRHELCLKAWPADIANGISIVVGETGIDYGIIDQSKKWGWRKFCNAKTYGDVLRAIDRRYHRCRNIVAAEVFGLHLPYFPNGDTFSINIGDPPEIRQAYLDGANIPHEEGPVPTQPEWWGRFLDIARERPQVGKAITQIGYDAFGNAVQYGENGKMEFNKDKDTGYYFPAAYRRSATAETEDLPEHPFVR